GEYLDPSQRANYEVVEVSVKYKDFSEERLVLPLESDTVRAIEVVEQEVITNEAIIQVDHDADGNFVYNPDIPVVKIAVIERHHLDRKSTRLNSSHVSISYAVFCLKKKHT